MKYLLVTVADDKSEKIIESLLTQKGVKSINVMPVVKPISILADKRATRIRNLSAKQRVCKHENLDLTDSKVVSYTIDGRNLTIESETVCMDCGKVSRITEQKLREEE